MSQSQVVSIPISVDQSPGDFQAIALYDNQSESSDELNFKKGDILKILERDFHGLAGWWLCALRDKVGLAPGNRLEIIDNTPEKPQYFRTSDSNQVGLTELTKGKMDGDIFKLAYGLYDVPKIVYDLQPSQQQEAEKQHEIPDILKDQTVNAHRGSNSNQILYSGLTKSPPLEETAIQKDHVYSGPDAYVWPDDLSLIPNGKKNSYNATSVNNGSFSSGKGPLENVQSSPRVSGQKASPSMNVSTYSNLQQQQQPSSLSPVGNTELKQHQQLVYQAPVNKRIIYSDSDNYDNLYNNAPPAVLVNGQSRPATENNNTIVTTTNNNMNKITNGVGKSNGNVQYYEYSRDPYRFLGVNGSQTLQHRPRRSEDCRIVARDDTDLQMRYKNDSKGKRDRSLRRVRFADQVTSSDTEEWAKNSDPIPNQKAVPLKPILSSSLSKSYCNANNSQSVSNRNNNNNNNNHNNENGYMSSTSDFANKQNNQIYYQEDVPDYENPYSEIADQPIYEKPPLAYISTSSKLNVDSQNGKPGKCYTSEFMTVLNTRDTGSNTQGENGNNTSPYYKNQVGSRQIHPPSLPKMFEGVYISPPDHGNLIENEPEFQLHFVDLPKKEQDRIPKSDDGSPKLSPELLNKSREKIQILANSMDGILNRKNAEDAEIATVILKSIDVELQFLVSVGEKGLKKSIETWSEDLIETLLQHLEDLRTIQGTLALLNKQILELTRDKSNVQHCQTFETICSSCALSARNICYPVHQFVAYLLPKFKFLFQLVLTISDVSHHLRLLTTTHRVTAQ